MECLWEIFNEVRNYTKRGGGYYNNKQRWRKLPSFHDLLSEFKNFLQNIPQSINSLSLTLFLLKVHKKYFAGANVLLGFWAF